MTLALGVSVDPWIYKAGLSVVPGSTTRSVGPRVVLLQVVEGGCLFLWVTIFAQLECSLCYVS